MTATIPAMADEGVAERPASDVEIDPPLRCSPIPLREPEAAVSVLPPAPAAPRWSTPGAVPVIQGTLALALPWEATLALALPWEATPAITYRPAGMLREGRERIPGHDHGRRSRGPFPAGRPGQHRPRDGSDRAGDRSDQATDRPGDLVPMPGPIPLRSYRGRPNTHQAKMPDLPELPDPREWATTFAQAAMEVAMGLRPAAQLIRWTSPDVHETLARRGALVARLVRRSGLPLAKPKLRALLLCTPAARACEVAAVVADSEKVRAVAFRMEGFQGRWRVTVFDLG